ncbi:MAG TPA: SHOCT domain-containing protein [Anaerolineales bacterium]|nr:SHOCT domain-containing protein [Anaerolineales bacterium]
MGKTGWIIGGAILIVLLVLGFSPVFFPAWGRGYGWGMMGPWMSGGWGMMGMMLVWPVLLVLVVGVFVAAIVWATRAASRGSSPGPMTSQGGETPLDVLKRRYANGEITKEQFEEMRRMLAQV